MRFLILSLACVLAVSGCAAKGELTSPCACLETPINAPLPTERIV